MSLGNNLYKARKNSDLSQEEVAEKLGVCRQTISKWELDETLPDIYQSKQLSSLYGLTLDELVDYDMDVHKIQDAIERTSDKVTEKIDWTKMWSKKYPVLAEYRDYVDTSMYVSGLKALIDDLQKRYGYDDLNAFLVLKDILGSVWKAEKGKR